MFPERIADATLHASYLLVASATTAWFFLIYAVIAGGAYLLAIEDLPAAADAAAGRVVRMRAGQLGEEMLLSALSILVFALQAVGLVWMLRRGWVAIDWARSPWHLIWELPLLYLWNELHFYAVHRALHWPPLYRSVHIWHHRSVVTTPFSAYSFHPAESFALGLVMPLALLAHDFSAWSMIGLTIMSLLLNVSGHLPHERVRALFAFARPHARYHNRHHREFRVHYSFSLPFPDSWLRR